MTSGDEDIGGDVDYLGCSFKTVIHRPTPHFYLPTTDNQSQQSPTTAPPPLPSPQQQQPPPPLPAMALTPSPLMSAPAVPIVVFPSPPANLPLQTRAHTDTDLLYYNQPNSAIFYQPNWYSPLPPGYFFVPPLPAAAVQPPPPGASVHPGPFGMQTAPYRSSSVDCRHTVNNVNEPHVVRPERVW